MCIKKQKKPSVMSWSTPQDNFWVVLVSALEIIDCI